jgi:hypothetical protein
LSSKQTEAAGEANGHADLAHAGAVVDKAIEHLLTQEIDPLAVASALLAGSLGLLTQAVGEDATMQVLNSAIASVKNGDLRPDSAESATNADNDDDDDDDD